MRRNDVKELTAGGNAHLVDAHQQVARHAQALVDAKTAIEVGVVDEAFPAHRGARLFEIHPHHHLEFAKVALALHGKLARVFDRGGRIMNGARADHHQQAVRLAVDDAAHVPARGRDKRLHRRVLNREKSNEVLGRWQGNDAINALVVGLRHLVGRSRYGMVVDDAGHDCLLSLLV